MAEVDAVKLVSLRSTHGLDQLDQLEGRFRVVAPGEMRREGPFVDTAAVMKPR